MYVVPIAWEEVGKNAARPQAEKHGAESVHVDHVCELNVVFHFGRNETAIGLHFARLWSSVEQSVRSSMPGLRKTKIEELNNRRLRIEVNAF